MRKIKNFMGITGTLLLALMMQYSLSAQVKFAAIGDYGSEGSNEEAVANLIDSWTPELIITMGDNNYPHGSASTIDENIGQYFHHYIYPYTGSYGNGSDTNKFFPSLGNHDWDASNAQPYLDYFELPGNERYYDFLWGNIHFFVIDSDPDEPDGTSQTSVQANWLHNAMQNSSSNLWKIVYFHHAPYSSGEHGSTSYMQWPFKEWGANTVLAGHDHTYERLEVDGLTYFVNGLGGRSRYSFPNIIPESIVRYNDEYGAMLLEAFETEMICKFINKEGDLIDSCKITRSIAFSEDDNNSLRRFSLEQNYPNPFNPVTNILYTISENSLVSLKIFNPMGELIETLIDEEKSAGKYSVKFNASKLPSGIYFYQLQAGDFTERKKMVLIK
jgi:hypothetical protein